MSRVSEFRSKFGVFGAGAVSKSLIGRLPNRAREFGPVSAVSFRLASRIANSLRAGHAVRSLADLDSASVVLFHAPDDQATALLNLLDQTALHWADKAVILCGVEACPVVLAKLRARGASLATLREFALPGRIAIDGAGRALAVAHRLARELRLKAVEIDPKAVTDFDVALNLATATLTPLIDQAAALFRSAGVREGEAARLAAALFAHTAGEFARSGQQSWAWYLQKPESARLRAHIFESSPELAPLLKALLLFGFDRFGKHQEVAEILRNSELAVSEQ